MALANEESQFNEALSTNESICLYKDELDGNLTTVVPWLNDSPAQLPWNRTSCQEEEKRRTDFFHAAGRKKSATVIRDELKV